MPRQPRRPDLLLPTLLCLIALLVGVPSLQAQGTCSSGNTAFSAHENLWGGDWRPGDRNGLLGQAGLPGERDSTTYTGNNQPNVNLPLYSSIDIEGDWAFTSYATGLSVWDISGAKAEKPGRTATFDIRNGPGCVASGNYVATPDCSELKEFFWDVDAPPGNPNIVAMSGLQPVGLTIIDTTNKNLPKLLYQDTGKGSSPAGTQVYAGTIGGRDYAFLGVDNGAVGLHLYDMTSAKTLNRCAENSSAGIECANVYKGRIGGSNVVQYVDGLGTSGKHYVATSGAVSDMGLRIWNVTNPSSPVSVSTHTSGKFLTTDVVFGMALWEQSNKQYLAIHIPGGGRIYDVTSCLANGCAALPAPVWTGLWSQYGTGPSGSDRSFVTFSRSGNKPMLYFGAMDQCSGGKQREFIFDVTSANNPVEVSSTAKMTINNKEIGYWSWYYSGNHFIGNLPSGAPVKQGFSRVTPMVAKFNGPNLYRAARTIFDVHVWAGGGSVPPNANFNVAGPDGGIYVGDLVQFTDTSSGSPTGWSWTFPGGNPASSTSQNPTVAFTSAGVKLVELRATNGAGQSAPFSLPVTVLDPSPRIESVATDPANGSFFTCDAVTFKADVKGKPLPAVTWSVSGHPANPTLPGGSTTVVPATGGTVPVTYTVTATPAGGAPVQKALTVNPPAALDFTDPSNGPKNDAFTAGTVTFHALAAGATNYNWDFGDGQGFRGYNTAFDKADPTFGYSSTGQKTVRVKIKNCGGELESAPLTINITQIAPLIIETFAIKNCSFGCAPGQKSFILIVSGGPTAYEYDWNGDGVFEDTTTGGPVDDEVKHTYAVGTYNPAVRVRRGTEVSDPKTHPTIIIENGPGPNPTNPTISISGPSTGQPNAAVSFSATASNCTPSATWNWNGAGGTVSGSGSTVSITWTTTGTKAVSVTNSGCSGATGTKSISIGSTTPPPGGLTANFSWSPASPAAGQTVTFDGGSSTGSPSGFTWDFGGGLTKSGQTVTHTFATPGAHTVKLEVVKPGNCALGLCVATATKSVAVGGPVGPPPIVPSFNTSASCIAEFGVNVCTANAGQALTFTDTSTGGSGPLTTRNWDFGDGTKVSGSPVTHTFKNGGNFVVTLTVGDGRSTATSSRNFTVAGPLALTASFNTSVSCPGGQCAVDAGVAVTFTDTSSGGSGPITSRAWDFGDGKTGSGSPVTHTFTTGGNFVVRLTVGDGASTASATRNFTVTGPTVKPVADTVVLPWVAQSRGALQQSSDLFIHNPGANHLGIVLEFRRQGLPEANPPRSAHAIAPGATLYVADVLKEMFGVENVAGFVTITKESGDGNPVISSFNTVQGKKGAQYGQTIPGVALSNETAAAATAGSRLQSLVGLNDDKEREAYFGVTNPNAEAAVIRLKFFDSLGRPIGVASGDVNLPSFGSKQYSRNEIRALFGINAQTDYRVEVETVSGKQVYPYGANVRIASKDPSYQGVGQSDKARLYLLGALNTKGLNNSSWQTDVVLSNTGTQVALADVTFTSAGTSSGPTAPLRITLQPGETERLANIGKQWNIKDAVGLITVESDSLDEVFPTVQGESYLNTKSAAQRFGQVMGAFTDEDAAGVGQSHFLVGLRQSPNHRVTYWVHNPSEEAGSYDIIYRGLNGAELGRIPNVTLGAGKLRQISPSQHPLSNKFKGLFTIQVVVKSGKALSAAHVVNNKTNDPAYVQGQAR